MGEVERALDRHANHPESTVRKAWERLEEWLDQLEHIDSEKEGMKRRLVEARGSSSLTELEALLADCASHKFKRELRREIFDVAERFDHLVERTVAQVEALLDTHELGPMEEALARYRSVTQSEVRAVCRRLAAHKEEREAHIKAADAVRLRLRQLAGSCSIAEGARALKTSAPLGVSVAAEREQLQAYVSSLQEAALTEIQAALAWPYLSQEEVDSLLQKHGAEDCVTDALHAARQDLSERRDVLSVRAHTVEAWRARLLGMVNVCRLDAAEATMRELGEEVSKEVLLELAREHAAMHTYHQRLQGGRRTADSTRQY